MEAFIKPGKELDQHLDGRKGRGVSVLEVLVPCRKADSSIVRLVLSLHLANSHFGGHGCTETVEKGSRDKRLESQG